MVPVTIAALLVVPSMLLNRTRGDPTLGTLQGRLGDLEVAVRRMAQRRPEA